MMPEGPKQSLDAMSGQAPILSHLSYSSLAEVLRLEDQRLQTETPYLFPVAFIALMCIIYIIANTLHNLFLPLVWTRQWKALKPEHRRTMVVYILQLIFTTIALILQLTATPLLVNKFTVWRVDVVRAAASLIAGLYLFELCYRYRMTYPMISHHFLTCFAMSLVVVMMERLKDPSFAITGLLWIFQATTEQSTFVALIMYRLSMRASTLRYIFYGAAVQSITFKLLSILGTIVIWARYQRQGTTELYHAWDTLFWIVTVGLASTQVWGTWVVWQMGSSLEERYRGRKTEGELSSPDKGYGSDGTTSPGIEAEGQRHQVDLEAQPVAMLEKARMMPEQTVTHVTRFD